MAAAKELMTWESFPGLGRWSKRSGKKRYRIGVKKLSQLYPLTVDNLTREGTRLAANQWWLEIEQKQKQRKPSPELMAVEILYGFQKSLREQAASVRDTTLVTEIDQRISQLKSLIEAQTELPGLTIKPANGSEDNPVDLIQFQENVDTATRARQKAREYIRLESSRFDGILPVTPEKMPAGEVSDRSLKSVIDRFLSLRKSELDAGNISVSRFTVVRSHLQELLEFVGVNSQVDHVSEEALSRYRMKLLSRVKSEPQQQRATRGNRGVLTKERPAKISAATAAGRMVSIKQFLFWCYEMRIINELPRNIAVKSASLSIPRSIPKEPATFSLAQFKTILDAATDRIKLYLLLMANCGFRQADIANLRVREIDLESGRICHSRIKTAKKAPPTVNYLLWSSTFQLLKSHLANQNAKVDSDSLVFVNENGGKIAKSSLSSDGKEKSSDNIRSAYWRVLDKLNISADERRTLGTLRTTSANMIRKQFSHELQQLFLGHKFQDIASRHYTSSWDDFRLDEPLRWLEKQYFV